MPAMIWGYMCPPPVPTALWLMISQAWSELSGCVPAIESSEQIGQCQIRKRPLLSDTVYMLVGVRGAILYYRALNCLNLKWQLVEHVG
jgi:hypothetical protein